MTDKATLLALADRLEKATAPSKELDALIADAVMERVNMNMGEEEHDDGSWKPCYRLGYGLNGARWSHPPQFTDSVDCALMLRPDGWLLTGLSDGIIDLKYRDVRSLTKWLTGMARVGAVVNGPEDVGEMVSSMGANPAISVAAAALRARAA